VTQPPPPDPGTGYPQPPAGYPAYPPPQPYLAPGPPPDPKLAPRRSSRLPWVLGGAAVFAALLCLAGALAVGSWLWTAREEGGGGVPLIAEATEATAAPPATGAEVETWLEIPASPVSSEPTLRSTGNGPSTLVAFVNDRSEPVIVSWLDPNGQRVEYQRLAPGASYVQPTYVGHPWVVSTADGTAIAVFQPVAQPGRAVIR